jgi:hypothetical protein
MPFLWEDKWERPSATTDRVPAVYPGSAYLAFFAILLFQRINNLRVFSATNSSIPTAAPANLRIDVSISWAQEAVAGTAI